MSPRMLRQLASWIALVAIVAVTFMPTFTQLLAWSDAGVDVCSAEASRRSGPGDAAHHALDHCPYCTLHAHLALLPTPPAAAGLQPVALVEFPAAFLQAPRARPTWSASQPRAPPRLV
jgi:hypothetical protein